MNQVVAALLLLFSVNAAAQDVSGVLRLTVDGADYSESVYSVPESVLPQPGTTSQQNLELSWQKGGFNTTATLRNQMTEHRKPEQDSFFNEFYLDTQLAGQDISLGRKIVSWGVGFGFRPLDVLQQEDRRQLYKNTLRGIDLLAWEKFFSTSALSLIWSNPGNGQHENNPARDESLALKYYGTIDTTDLHLVARTSQRERMQLGIGISSVPTDSLEWHGSLLWQCNYFRRINRLIGSGAAIPLADDNPFVRHQFHNGLKGLAGIVWTHTSGWGLLAEIWYDHSAYNRNQWRDLNSLSREQQQLLTFAAVPPDTILGNIAYTQQAFLPDNLQQWNTLLRLSRQGSSLEPVLEFLYTPEDRGWVSSATVNYQLDRQRLEAGFRLFGGASNSAYSQLPQERAFYLSWSGSF